MSSVDRILELLDQGLQSSGDQAYPTEWGERAAESCWKCGAPGPLTTIDACAGCAAWLRGEDVPEPERVHAGDLIVSGDLSPYMVRSPLGGVGLLLRAAFGVDETTTIDGPYTHTFVPWSSDDLDDEA